jgi:hypothetical protein
MHKEVQAYANTHVGPRAYRQEQRWQHIVLMASAEAVDYYIYYTDAGSVLYADSIASSRTPGPPVNQIQSAEGHSWNSPSVASGLKAHLHKHYLHDYRFGMPGKHTQVQRNQYCRRHRTEGMQTVA